MSRHDLPRILTAARQFITVITRHARQYNAPGYEHERHMGCAEVAHAASELHLALEGRTIFDPPAPPDDSPFRTFAGTESDVALQIGVTIQLRVIRECLRRLLRRIGYRGEHTEGAAHGSMPSIKGLEGLPQVGLPELPDLILATKELEALTVTRTTARLERASPRARLQVFDKAVPPSESMAAETAAGSDIDGDETVLYERIDGTTGWFAKEATPEPHVRPARGESVIRDYLIEAFDERTGRRSWVRFTWGPFGIRKPPDCRYPYWQISVDDAAAWFSANCLSPPATLLDDLRAEQEATKAPTAPPPRENEQPAAAPASVPEAPQDRDRQIADLLKANGTITSREIARRVKTSDSTVRRSTPWTEHQARRANHRREKTIRTRALTGGVLASKAGGDDDPSELAAEREVMEQQYLADVDPETSDDDEARYLDQASPEELLEYRQMSPAEQKHAVKTWLLYNV
jgi:Winged helix-turn-helix DNA-binding